MAIDKCRASDITSDRPKSEQKWCVYTSDKKRLLGRHPSREKALKQLAAIEISKKAASASLTFREAAADPNELGKFGSLIFMFLEIRFLQFLTQYFHWEVKGPTSYSDHMMYGKIYEQLQVLSDGFAERLVAFSTNLSPHVTNPGVQAAYTTKRIQSLKCKEWPILNPCDMALCLYQEFLNFTLTSRVYSEAMDSEGYLTLGLEDLIASTSDEIESMLYFLERRTGLSSGELMQASMDTVYETLGPLAYREWEKNPSRDPIDIIKELDELMSSESDRIQDVNDDHEIETRQS